MNRQIHAQDLSLLQQLPELLDGQSAILEDLVKQAGADGFAKMRWHNRAAATLVTQEVMAALTRRTREPPFSRAAHRHIGWRWCYGVN